MLSTSEALKMYWACRIANVGSVSWRSVKAGIKGEKMRQEIYNYFESNPKLFELSKGKIIAKEALIEIQREIRK